MQRSRMKMTLNCISIFFRIDTEKTNGAGVSKESGRRNGNVIITSPYDYKEWGSMCKEVRIPILSQFWVGCAVQGSNFMYIGFQKLDFELVTIPTLWICSAIFLDFSTRVLCCSCECFSRCSPSHFDLHVARNEVEVEFHRCHLQFRCVFWEQSTLIIPSSALY